MTAIATSAALAPNFRRAFQIIDADWPLGNPLEVALSQPLECGLGTIFGWGSYCKQKKGSLI